MIGDFSNWEEEKGLVSAAVAEALDFIRTADFAEMADGVYPIGDDGAALIVKRVVTAPFDTVRPEKHERLIDIHYMISGTEKIGFARHSARNRPVDVKPPVEDHQFFERVEGELELILHPGQYAVFMPSDVHRPWCTANEAAPAVRKALYKLPVSAWEQSPKPIVEGSK